MYVDGGHCEYRARDLNLFVSDIFKLKYVHTQLMSTLEGKNAM